MVGSSPSQGARGGGVTGPHPRWPPGGWPSARPSPAPSHSGTKLRLEGLQGAGGHLERTHKGHGDTHGSDSTVSVSAGSCGARSPRAAACPPPLLLLPGHVEQTPARKVSSSSVRASKSQMPAYWGPGGAWPRDATAGAMAGPERPTAPLVAGSRGRAGLTLTGRPHPAGAGPRLLRRGPARPATPAPAGAPSLGGPSSQGCPRPSNLLRSGHRGAAPVPGPVPATWGRGALSKPSGRPLLGSTLAVGAQG